MPDDLRADLIENFLARAGAAARRREWAEVLDLVEDVLVLDRDNPDALTLRLVAEHHERGLPSWGRRQETVLFADLVGSTPMANRFDPELTRRLIRAYELACTPVLTALGGHVHRFVGDGILASFGFPTSHEDDARRAVHAGLDVVKAVAATSRAHAASGAELQVRIGIASGVLVHSDRGGGTWNQTGDLFGPAVNLAARLHELAEPGQICISDETADLVRGFFELEPLGLRSLKGFDLPLAVHRVVRRTEVSSLVDRPAVPPSPLVGRRDELRDLWTRWETVAGANTAVAVLITGEPGVGKSRLVRELVELTTSSGRQLVELQCSGYRTASPLYPVRAALERYSGIEPGDDDETRLAKLSGVLAALDFDLESLPYIALLLELKVAGRQARPELGAIQLREFTLGHLQALVIRLAATQPCVLVVEDVHWADPSTRDLLQRVIATRPSGLLIVVTSRRVPEWVSGGYIEPMELAPLSPDETRAMARAVSADRLSPDLVEEIARRSDGIPLFVEQLADSLARAERGDARGMSAIPASLAELLQARLDAAGSSKRVAQLAATIGREFEPELVGALARQLQDGGKLERLDRPVRFHLDRLIASNLVEPSAEDGRLRFRHALVRQAAYESQLLDERPERHEALAWLLHNGGTTGRAADPAVVARHFEAAGSAGEAIAHYLEAATRGQAVGAFAEVAAHLDRAIALLPDVDGDARSSFELALRLTRGSAVMATGGYAAPGVQEDFDRAVELCEILREATDVRTHVLQALVGSWSYYCVGGNLARARTVSDALEQQLVRADLAATWRTSLHACRGCECFFGGNLADAHHHLQTSVDTFPIDDFDWNHWPLTNDPLGAVLSFLAPLKVICGDEPGALAAVAAGLERCQQFDFPRGPYTVAFVRNYETLMHRLRGKFDDAASAAEELLRIGERHGFFDWMMTGRMHMAAAVVASDPSPSPSSLAELGDAIATWRGAGGESLMPTLLLERGWGYASLGDRELAGACLDDADDIIRRGQELSAAEAHRLRAELAALSNGPGDPAVAGELEAGLRFAVSQGAHLYVLRGAASYERWLGLDRLDPVLRAGVDRAISAFGADSGIPGLLFGSGRVPGKLSHAVG